MREYSFRSRKEWSCFSGCGDSATSVVLAGSGAKTGHLSQMENLKTWNCKSKENLKVGTSDRYHYPTWWEFTKNSVVLCVR